MSFEDYATKIGIDRYARIDEGSSMRIANFEHVPGWFGTFIYCLKNGDEESALLIRRMQSMRDAESWRGSGMSEKYSFQQYQKAVEFAISNHPQWRRGQAAFNVLMLNRPELSERIRGTALDPYYDRDGSLLQEFYKWVEANWD